MKIKTTPTANSLKRFEYFAACADTKRMPKIIISTRILSARDEMLKKGTTI